MRSILFLLISLIKFISAEGYYCPYTELQYDGTNDIIYDYYSLQGNVYIRLNEIGRTTRTEYCREKGDLSIHTDAGETKCNDSSSVCIYSNSMCTVDTTKQPDCLELCKTILNGGGLNCLGSACPNNNGDRSVIYAICDTNTNPDTTKIHPPDMTTIPTLDTTTIPTPNQNCSWLGHCLNASCVTDNDCSDNLVCNTNVCTTENNTVNLKVSKCLYSRSRRTAD